MGNVGEDGVKVPIVAIPCSNKALWVAAVAIMSPKSDEACQVLVQDAEQDAVTAIPSVVDGHKRVLGDWLALFQRGGCDPLFAAAVLVEGLQVDRAAQCHHVSGQQPCGSPSPPVYHSHANVPI